MMQPAATEVLLPWLISSHCPACAGPAAPCVVPQGHKAELLRGSLLARSLTREPWLLHRLLHGSSAPAPIRQPSWELSALCPSSTQPHNPV